MLISERILKMLQEKNMTQAEFAKQAGIATSTVSEWKKKKTNPSADKIMDICSVLEITPEQLLSGRGIDSREETEALLSKDGITPIEWKIINDYHEMKEEQKERLLKYIEALKQIDTLEKMDSRS